MLRLDLGLGDNRRAARYCDGIARSFLQVGVAGLASVGLPEILRARAETVAQAAKNTSVILIWLDGGPGHMDMYDMKPDAPDEYRGIWMPIRTRVPGFDISELFPLQAQITDKFSMVRSLHHKTGDHFAGGHRMLTTKDMGVSGANAEQRFPSIGAIVARECGPRKRGMPGYVAVPYGMSIGLRPGYFGGHFLGGMHNPYETVADANAPDFKINNLNLANGLTLDRLEDRRSLVKHFDTTRKHLDGLPTTQVMDRYEQEAFEFVSGPTARRAFDINMEDPRLRNRYGRTSWGQSTLLARRLVEAGATFVTAHFGGWDNHWDLKAAMDGYLPQVDRAVSALFIDLEQRGLLDTTLVMMCGEFSRTPKMNDGGNGGAPRSMGTPGRDHWGDAMFCLMGGGGLKGGQVIGSTDRLGMRPNSRPITPCNVHATIYQVLGIDPKIQFLDPSGRPVNALEQPEAISELL